MSKKPRWERRTPKPPSIVDVLHHAACWGNNEEDPSVRFPVTQAEQISGWILEVAKEIQDNPKPESPTE